MALASVSGPPSYPTAVFRLDGPVAIGVRLLLQMMQQPTCILLAVAFPGSPSASVREEETMNGIVARLVIDDHGQDLAEYGIALAAIGVIAGAAAVVIALDVGTLWSQAQSVIDSAATS
jgi:Flp pilus assembly pilin Flp